MVLPGLAAAAALAPLLPGFPKPKRELSDELFSREPQVEGEQELDARVIPLPAITAGLAGLSSITPLIPSFVNRPKREVTEEFDAREFSEELDARVLPLPAITAGLAGLSSITPLIPSFVNRPKREPEPQGPILSLPKVPKIFRFLP